MIQSVIRFKTGLYHIIISLFMFIMLSSRYEVYKLFRVVTVDASSHLTL